MSFALRSKLGTVLDSAHSQCRTCTLQRQAGQERSRRGQSANPLVNGTKAIPSVTRVFSKSRFKTRLKPLGLRRLVPFEQRAEPLPTCSQALEAQPKPGDCHRKTK